MAGPEPSKRGFAAFWTTLPGIITGIAGFIGAIAAVLALFLAPDPGDDGVSRAEWADKVDPICSEAIDAARQTQFPTTSDLNLRADYVRQIGRIARDMSKKVRAIEAPTEDQSSIDRMTALWDQQADRADEIAFDLQISDFAAAQTAAQQGDDAATEGDALATSLGVTACAQTPTPALATELPTDQQTPPEQASAGTTGPSTPGPGKPCGEGVSAGPNTSCEFALNVAASYHQSGGASSIDVYSPVTGDTYTMSCTSGSPHACTGGNNASVYFP